MKPRMDTNGHDFFKDLGTTDHTDYTEMPRGRADDILTDFMMRQDVDCE